MTLRKLGVALLGVLLVGLAGLALPKARKLIYLHNEGETNGNLRAIRSALSIYRDDRHGQYPPDLAALTKGGIYLSKIPVAKYSSHHWDSSEVHQGEQR